MIADKELKELKESLPRGYFNKVLERVSFSERKVANFFNGRIYNSEIHEAALQVLNEHKAQVNNIRQKQSTLLK